MVPTVMLAGLMSLLGSATGAAGTGAAGSGLLGGASSGLSSLVSGGTATGATSGGSMAGKNLMEELMKRAVYSAASSKGGGGGQEIPVDHLSAGRSEGTNKTQDMMSQGTAQNAMSMLQGLPHVQSQYRPLQTRYDNPYLKSLLGV